MILPVDAAKGFPLVNLSKEPPILIPTEPPTHIIENTTILLENARPNPIPGLDRIHLGMFPPPPPGLTIDPSKMCHVPAGPSVAAVALQPAQPSSYLTLPPPQVLNAITTVEQQKQLMVWGIFLIPIVETYAKVKLIRNFDVAENAKGEQYG